MRLGLAWLVVASSALAASPKVIDQGIVIEDVTLISPERPAPVQHASVVVRDRQIVEIGTNLVAGPNATKLDGRDRYLIPGLIDSHVHIGYTASLDSDAVSAHPELLEAYRSQLPRSYLAFGFTTLVDLNLSDPETLRWFSAAAVHPNLYHCGCAVHVPGGYGALRPPKDVAAAKAANLVYQPSEAKEWPADADPRDFTPARAVDRVVASGGICVKTFVETGFGGVFHWPVPSSETLRALRAETRRRGLVLIIHANAVEAWRAVLNAQADVIAHGLWHWPGDRLGTTPPQEAREVIAQAAAAGIGVQPTLQAVYGDESIFDRSVLDDPRLKEALPRALAAYLNGDEAKVAYRATSDEYRQMITKFFGPSLGDDPGKAMEIPATRATATLRIMLADKVKLLLGSDTPSNDGIGNPPGLNGRMEMSRWAEAGVPLARILRAATIDNAKAFGLSKELGTIETGKRADLLLLRSDPLQTIDAYDAIDTILLNGAIISRASLFPK
jgi:imidazolonepropionase-like amidohydrolase